MKWAMTSRGNELAENEKSLTIALEQFKEIPVCYNTEEE